MPIEVNGRITYPEEKCGARFKIVAHDYDPSTGQQTTTVLPVERGPMTPMHELKTQAQPVRQL